MDVNSKIDLGAVKIQKNVIASIASISASEIEGVKQIGAQPNFSITGLLSLKTSKAIRVEFGKNDEIKLEIPLIVKYGYNIHEIAEAVQ